MPFDVASAVHSTAQIPLGDYPAVPFPAPVWFLRLFLVVGFFLHAIPMNVALMGGLIAAIFLIAGKVNKHSYSERLGNSLAAALPLFTSFAITNGIVPLLFLQVLYGPLIYASSIVMATPWFSVLGLIAIGYYGLYVFAYRREALANRGPWLLIGVSLLFMVVGFFFSNNMSLMLTPQKFLPLYQASNQGMNLNLNTPSLIPRYLHFVLAAVSVVGLLIGCFGLYQKNRDDEYSNFLIKTGTGLFLSITLLQVLVGFWYFYTLTPAVQHNLMGGHKHGTGVFMSSMGLTVVSLVAMALAWAKTCTKAFWVGLVSSMLLIFTMVATRDVVREYMIAPYINPSLHAANPQWDLLALFLLSFVGLIVYLIWLGRITWAAFHPAGPSGAPGSTQ